MLDAPESTITLTYNYRMNRTITDLANKLTYENQLLIGNEAVANNSLHLLNHEVRFNIETKIFNFVLFDLCVKRFSISTFFCQVNKGHTTDFSLPVT